MKNHQTEQILTNFKRTKPVKGVEFKKDKKSNFKAERAAKRSWNERVEA